MGGLSCRERQGLTPGCVRDHGRNSNLGSSRSGLPFGPRTAQRLVVVARNSRFAKTTHGSLLPPNWRTLYEITKLSDENV